MNCEEVKNYLTEYLDETLDVATTTRVATHIIACPPCRADTDELADCVQQVGALPLIDPPLGFAQRVMAHVREIEPERSIWQRLFLPLGKIPQQAAAVILVAVLAGFLYQKDDRFKTIGTSEIAGNSNSAAPQVSKAESATAGALTEAEKIAPSAPQTAAIAKSTESATLRKSKSLSAGDQIQTAKAEQLAAEPRQEESFAIKRAPIPVQEVSNPRDSVRLPGDMLGFDFGIPSGAFRQPARRLESSNIERAVEPLFQRNADIEFVVRRHAAVQRRDQADALGAASLRKSADADGPATSSAAGVAPASAPAAKIESIAEIRYYNVAPEHFESFKKDLAQESVIETESKPSVREKEAAAQSARPLLIKVTILPPVTADSSAAPR